MIKIRQRYAINVIKMSIIIMKREEKMVHFGKTSEKIYIKIGKKK